MGLNEAMLVVVSILEGKFDCNKPFHFDLHNMPVIILVSTGRSVALFVWHTKTLINFKVGEKMDSFELRIRFIIL